MQLNKIQKAKIIMSTNFAVLFGMIIITPHFVRTGIGPLSETFVEGFFLAVEVMALFMMFRHYDFIIRESERKNLSLSLKLRKKERELLSAFQYLGKLNVQFSMIKNVLEKMKVPSTRGQLKEVYSDLLRIVCSATGRNCAGLKIVDLNSGRTMGEFFEFFHETSTANCIPDISNNELINVFNNKKSNFENGKGQYLVFYSGIKNFFIKAFIYIPKEEDKKINTQEKDFLEAIANQCEIFFLLFDARRYQK